MGTLTGFRVMSKPCSTCIYRGDLDWNLDALEDQVRDPHMGFKGHRECHHKATDGGRACCRGFWNAHKDEFQMGQIAQRVKAVAEVEPGEKFNASGRERPSRRRFM